MRPISVKNDWKHVIMQKVVTLNTCCDIACLTFQLPHITTSSFQSHVNNPQLALFRASNNVLCRRALMQYLESRVTPLLAGVLAYIDTNNNLDVLVHNSEPWLRHMWLHMLADSNITELKYR